MADKTSLFRQTIFLSGTIDLIFLLVIGFLGILFVANIVVLGNNEAAVRMHWDLWPAADGLLVTGKVLVCFVTGILYLIAAYGIFRHQYPLALAGIAGAALFVGYYLVELVSWGRFYLPVWVGFLSFGGISVLIGMYSWMKWQQGKVVNKLWKSSRIFTR